jgi:hypothetical protein
MEKLLAEQRQPLGHGTHHGALGRQERGWPREIFVLADDTAIWQKWQVRRAQRLEGLEDATRIDVTMKRLPSLVKRRMNKTALARPRLISGP